MSVPTLNTLIEMQVPAPFVKDQKKQLALCTTQDVGNAIKVLKVTDGDSADIEFLALAASKFDYLNHREAVVKGRLDLWLGLLDFRINQKTPAGRKRRKNIDGTPRSRRPTGKK